MDVSSLLLYQIHKLFNEYEKRMVLIFETKWSNYIKFFGMLDFDWIWNGIRV